MQRILFIAIAAVLMFSGCVGSGSLKSHAATLSYNGSENGKHDETTKCDQEGHIHGSGTVSDGEVMVTVTDAHGDSIWDHTYDGSFTLNSTTITGAAGTWKLSADRSGNDVLGDQFKGSYDFTLTC